MPMGNETDYGRHLLKLATKLTARLFRNNTGMAWQGEVRKNRDGSITIKKPRPLHAGLIKGGSDLIGWMPLRITQDMVGDTVAVFTAVEVKVGTDATPEQESFINAVKTAGGFAGIARKDEDLTMILCPDLQSHQSVDNIASTAQGARSSFGAMNLP